eukprot:scaffold266795_cov17-Prasinocladus_malaysianus.AAC.1
MCHRETNQAKSIISAASRAVGSYRVIRGAATAFRVLHRGAGPAIHGGRDDGSVWQEHKLCQA